MAAKKSSKPLVFSNLAISLDGKIAPREGKLLLGSSTDRKEMAALRMWADAVVMGAGTLRSHPYPALAERLDKSLKPKKAPIQVVVSKTLAGMRADWPFFREPNLNRVVFTDPKAPEDRLAPLKGLCTIERLGQEPVAETVVHRLTAMGARKILVEGGGDLMWEFTQANLIDEYHVTLTPWILGGKEAPTLVGGLGFAADVAKRLRLKKMRKLGQELFLVYVPA